MFAVKPIVAVFTIALVHLIFAQNSDSSSGEISKAKCREYAKYVPESYKCPFSTSDELTVGGSFAVTREFPHAAIVGRKTQDEGIQWLCTGSLISEQFILLAGHCLKNSSNEALADVFVRLGVTNLNDTNHVQDFQIKKVIPHPDYQSHSAYNDIGLVQLERNVSIDDNVRPACLSTANASGIDKAINSAWGYDDFIGPFNEIMQKAVLEIYTQEKCNKIYDKPSKQINNKISNGITYENMVCAGTSSIVTPQPKTGGPLLVYHKEEKEDLKCMYDIIGIASFGWISFFKKDIPDVYTRVAPYIPWIEATVWK